MYGSEQSKKKNVCFANYNSTDVAIADQCKLTVEKMQIYVMEAHTHIEKSCRTLNNMMTSTRFVTEKVVCNKTKNTRMHMSGENRAEKGQVKTKKNLALLTLLPRNGANCLENEW